MIYKKPLYGKYFGDRFYTPAGSFLTKQEARAIAKGFRRRGYHARTTNQYIRGWSVWVNKRSN